MLYIGRESSDLYKISLAHGLWCIWSNGRYHTKVPSTEERQNTNCLIQTIFILSTSVGSVLAWLSRIVGLVIVIVGLGEVGGRVSMLRITPDRGRTS